MLLASLVILLAGSVISAPLKADPVKVELVSSVGSVTPGTPFTVGVVFKIEKGWHIYWKFAGDAGLPPEIHWKLPEGWKTGDIQWPIPTRFTEKGPLTTYGYSDSVMLLTEITPPATSTEKAVMLTAAVDWMVCQEECVPGKGTFSVSLPVGASTTSPNPGQATNSRRIDTWRNSLPSQVQGTGIRIGSESSRSNPMSKIAQVKLTFLLPKGASMSNMAFYPNPGKDLAVKKIVTSVIDGNPVIKFNLQSFKEPMVSRTRIEGLVVYTDASGKRRGLTLTPPIVFDE